MTFLCKTKSALSYLTDDTRRQGDWSRNVSRNGFWDR